MDRNRSVGELAIERPAWIEVFEQFGIDYCCRGADSLAAACEAAGCGIETVLAALQAGDGSSESTAEIAADASLRELIDHILDTHHVYLERELPRIETTLDKVLMVHGAKHPELRELSANFRALRAELEDHMAKEEQILFPMIQSLEASRDPRALHCGSMQGPITVMEHEHDAAGAALRRMRELTDGYTPPADACASFTGLYGGLAALERDLHRHIHKENNLLHPRAKLLEAELL